MIIVYTETIAEAQEFVGRFRPVEPVVYNAARLLEQSVPEEKFVLEEV